jgi:hypothetical protein
MMVPVHQLVPIIGTGGAECCPPAPEKVLTCAGKAADLFHSGSSSCRFVLLMPLVLSTDDAFCHSGLDPESLSCPFGRTGPLVLSTERNEWRSLFETFRIFFKKNLQI